MSIRSIHSARRGLHVTRRGLAGILAGGALSVAVAPLLAGPAVAAPAAPGYVRIAQLSPNSAPVDVYVDNRLVLAKAGFTTVDPYQAIAAGSHTLAVRTAGTSAAAPAAFTEAFTITTAQDYTATVLGTSGHLTTSVFSDAFPAAPSGMATIRLLHAAPGVPAVDVTDQSGASLFKDVAYDHPTGYSTLGGGSYNITMAQAGTDKVLWVVKGVAVKAGSAYTLAAVGGSGLPLRVLALTDARGTAADPLGGIQTGLGGTAHSGHDTVALLLLGAGGVFVLGGLLTLRRRTATA